MFIIFSFGIILSQLNYSSHKRSFGFPSNALSCCSIDACSETYAFCDACPSWIRKPFCTSYLYSPAFVKQPGVYSHFHLSISTMASLLFQIAENVADNRTEARRNLLCIFINLKIHLTCLHAHSHLVNSPL